MRSYLYLALTLVCLLTLKVTAQTSGGAASYCQRGFEQFQKGDLDAAIADFTTAVTFDPGYVPGVSESRHSLVSLGPTG